MSVLRNHWGKLLLAVFALFVAAMVSTPVKHYKVRFRSNTPFKMAHQRAINSFVDSEYLGIRRMLHDPPDKYWAESSFAIEDRIFHVHSIHLIGMTPEGGPRFYQSHRRPAKVLLPEIKHRELTAEEAASITQLANREVDFALLEEEPSPNKSGYQVEVIAPIFAQEKCLKCHEAEVGDLLGAFSYRTFVKSRNP